MSSPQRSGVVGSKHQVQYFKGQIPSPQIMSNDDICTATNSYQDSCDPDFQKCSDLKQCPFDDPTDIYDCVYDGKIGVINKKSEVLKTVCVPQQSQMDEYGEQVIRVTGYRPCDCYTKDCSECGGHDINIDNVDGDCNNLFVDPNSETGQKYLQFNPSDPCNYSGNWPKNNDCSARDEMLKGLQTYEYTNKKGTQKSSAMEPVIYYGDFYGETKYKCSKKSWKQDVLVRMCDKTDFQNTIDTEFEDVGQIVRPKNFCGIDAGYTKDSWNSCSPQKVLWTIKNTGEATGGDCKQGGSDYWDYGCGSRCACQEKLAATANSFYIDNTDWKFRK
jgi:hypothetical protein